MRNNPKYVGRETKGFRKDRRRDSALCDVKDIPAEIEESANVVARILNTTTKLGRYRRKEAKKTIQVVNNNGNSNDSGRGKCAS